MKREYHTPMKHRATQNNRKLYKYEIANDTKKMGKDREKMQANLIMRIWGGC